jgi:predicted GNAT superfamily acetyltransferase
MSHSVSAARPGGTTSGSSTEYVIREPRDMEDFAQLARVFQAVFRLADPAAPPAWLMEDTTKAGGLTLGLWLGDKAVGFSYAFGGIDKGVPSLYSDGLGVLPEHRAHGQAYAMKLAQREHALKLGYQRITWTFSALRSVNAHLYLTRLGAVASKYILDNRGPFGSEWQVEGDVPLDEFFVEWQLDSERVRSRLESIEHAPELDAARVISRCTGSPPMRVLEHVDDLPGTDRVAVEVPSDFQALVDEAPALAHDWRNKTRPLFARLIEDGYVLTESPYDPVTRRGHYVFERLWNGA